VTEKELVVGREQQCGLNGKEINFLVDSLALKENC
jgi:hypothetical protein